MAIGFFGYKANISLFIKKTKIKASVMSEIVVLMSKIVKMEIWNDIKLHSKQLFFSPLNT